jgi:hypothetical protein
MPDLARFVDEGGAQMTGRARGSDAALRRKVVLALEQEARGMSPLEVVNRLAATPRERKVVKSEVRDLLNRGDLTIGADLRLHVK